MWLLEKKINLYPKRFECSYCEGIMLFTFERVKRQIPQGAKDLNIYDDIECWQCIKCGQTSTDFIR